MPIPRNIFFFWHDLRTMPKELEQSIRASTTLHPDYRVLLADDDYVTPLIASRYGVRMAQLYTNNRIPASRSDIARVVLLREHGGVYVDADIELRRHLQTWVASDVDLMLTRYMGHTVNGLVGATQNHPLLEQVLRNIRRNLEHGYFNGWVSAATGPMCWDAVIRDFGVPERTQVAKWHELDLEGRIIDHARLEASRNWRVAQMSGLARDTSLLSEHVDPPRSSETRDCRADPAYRDLMQAERDYLEAHPTDTTLLLSELPRRFASEFNRWLTGTPEESWLDHVASKGPFPNAALLTNGVALLKADVFQKLRTESVTVYTGRRRGVERALSALPAQSNVQVRIVDEDPNFVELPPQAFDLVLSQFFLHRVHALDRLFSEINASLAPGGVCAFLEYVGEDRFAASTERLHHTQQLLDAFQSQCAALVSQDWCTPLRHEFGPLGAVRSSEILPAARRNLSEHHLRTCLHAPLAVHLARHNPTADSDCLVRVLTDHEKRLQALGRQGTLAFGVYSSRSTTPRV